MPRSVKKKSTGSSEPVKPPRRPRAHWKSLTIHQRSARLVAAATPSELKLHAIMSADPRLAGKFKFQAHIKGCYPDFSFRHCKLIIELDGACHSTPEARYSDARRTAMLKKSGWRVIRFWNSALKNPQEVVERIWCELNHPVISF